MRLFDVIVVMAVAAMMVGTMEVEGTHSLDVPVCKGAFDFQNAAETEAFVLSSGSSIPPMHTTHSKLCYTHDGLYVLFEAEDAFTYNPYKNCNDDLYEYDVVEMFIAPGLGSPVSAPQHYVELEISPSGVLFESHIYNPYDTCHGINGTLIPCDGSGIVAHTSTTPSGWEAQLFVPFSVISPTSPPPSTLAVNMFRIDIVDSQGAEQFIAWSPTDTPEPCFHVPSKFGRLHLTQ